MEDIIEFHSNTLLDRTIKEEIIKVRASHIVSAENGMNYLDLHLVNGTVINVHPIDSAGCEMLRNFGIIVKNWGND